MNRTTRGALQALGAAFLLAMLVFLFVKTAGMDVKQDTHALSLLREMKDLDSRWDEDVLRMANDFSGAAPRADFPLQMGRILSDLERSGPGSAFGHDLAQLRAGLGDKDLAARSLRDAHQRTLEASRAADTALQLLQQLAEARATQSRGAHGAIVSGLVSQLRGDATQPIDAFPGREPAMQQRIATLRLESLAIDPSLGGAAGRAEAASRALVAARESELSLWRKYSFLTLGGRIDLALRTLSTSVENTLDEKDRWRAYLFTYALALLIATGYLAHARGAGAGPASQRQRKPREARDRAHAGPVHDPQAPAGIRGPARAVGKDVLARPDGGGRRPRDEFAARVREEQRGHGPRSHAGPSRALWSRPRT